MYLKLRIIMYSSKLELFSELAFKINQAARFLDFVVWHLVDYWSHFRQGYRNQSEVGLRRFK